MLIKRCYVCEEMMIYKIDTLNNYSSCKLITENN